MKNLVYTILYTVPANSCSIADALDLLRESGTAEIIDVKVEAEEKEE